LVDGVVFGRPLLRLADRPPINIPPRKKRRIVYDEQDSTKEALAILEGKAGEPQENGDRQLVLHADFDDEDSEEDEDFCPGEDGEEEEDDNEDADLESEPGEEEAGEVNLPFEPQRGNYTAYPEPSTHEIIEKPLIDVKSAATRANIRKLQAAFPKAKLGVCKHVLKGTGNDMGQAYEAMLHGFKPVQSKSAVTQIQQDHGVLSMSKARTEVQIEEEPEVLNSMLVEPDTSSDPFVSFYDQNGLPPGSIASGKALSFMADAVKYSPLGHRSEASRSPAISNKSVRFSLGEGLPKDPASTPQFDKNLTQEVTDEEDSDGSSEESSEDSSEESSSEESSSDDDSSKVSSDSSEEGQSSAKELSSSESGSDSSSDSSSDDEEPEEESSKTSHTITYTYKCNGIPCSQLDVSVPRPQGVLEAVPPGKGMKATRKRNERRRKANALNRYKERGILPAGATILEFCRLGSEQLLSPESALAALQDVRSAQVSVENQSVAGQAASNADKLEQRRQELMASILEGGIDVEKESGKKMPEYTSRLPKTSPQNNPINDTTELVANVHSIGKRYMGTSPLEKPTVDATTAINKRTELTEESAASERHTTLSPQTSSNNLVEPPSMASGTPRAKLNLAAGKRMLFGALGIKPPKTRDDKEKVRQDLMKNVKPLIALKKAEEPIIGKVVDEDLDVWKENITYRAVECVQEGIELSEPPFPFEQRWDPQQNSSKRKKDQRDQSQYYNDNRASKKNKRRKAKHNPIDQYEHFEEPLELSYDDSYEAQYHDSVNFSKHLTLGKEGEKNQQLMDDVNDPDDLASLPDDPSSLPELVTGAAKVGMTLAFKCLEMSEATNWQPRISPYRTAIVVSISNGGELQLSLAMRDRSEGKVYDVETGERIYGKFEMPDDDNMEEEEEGVLNLSFSELLEPKIVQDPPSAVLGDAPMDKYLQDKVVLEGDMSGTTHTEEQAHIFQVEGHLSLVEETPLDYGAAEHSQSAHVIEFNDQPSTTSSPKFHGFQSPNNDMGLMMPDHESIHASQPAQSSSGIVHRRFETPTLSSQQPNEEDVSDLIPVGNVSQDTSLPSSTSLEKESNTSLQYPKLSVGSSFSSQITDHGRQPDFDFEDTTALGIDTPSIPSF
jgi:hypothetical protein